MTLEEALKGGNKRTDKPYISINKLGEYMTARPIRRRQILKSLKEDSKFFKVRYSQVKSAMPQFFAENYNTDILATKLRELNTTLQSTDALSPFEINDTKNSVLALEALMSATLPDLSNYDVKSPNPKIDDITLAGVAVTIKPEIYLKHKQTGKIGGVKLHYSKTEDNRLNAQAMKYVATLIRFGFIEHGIDTRNIANEGCLSIDVFDGTSVSAPQSYVRSIDELKAACEEIAAMWERI